ncbi:MAG: hypothetical protein EA398_02635 [Deltaproteobacteria bacterium]|nr:MAG: hypothetical protein EA398_02635 [Deltaproteobacteria bacterium]
MLAVPPSPRHRRHDLRRGPFSGPHAPLTVFLVLFLALAGCGDDDSAAAESGSAAADASATSSADFPSEPTLLPGPEAFAERGPHRVVDLRFDLTDPERTLPDPNGGGEPVPRVLPVRVWHTTAETPPGPLIVWAHGLGSTNLDNPRLANSLASRGWVVAKPNFPRTTRTAPVTDVTDVVNQPGDLSLLIDHMIERNADPDDPLHGRFDPGRIAVGGVSLGGATALLTAWTPEFRDPRIGAVVSLGPPACYLPRPLFPGEPLPMLVMHGDADAIVSWESHGERPFADAPAPSLLLRLRDGSHTAFADTIADLFANFDQPDELGCATIGRSIPLDDLGSLAESIGGPDAATVNAECAAPCSGDELERVTMRPPRQANLVLYAVVTFLEGVFEDGPSLASLGMTLDAEEDVDARTVLP